MNLHWYDEQIQLYKKLTSLYEKMAAGLKRRLQIAMSEMGMDAIVQARAKTISSYAEKIVRKQSKYADPIRLITDLCGLRIIVERLDEVRRLCDFIETEFEIDEGNSEDCLERLKINEFGYLSNHYIVMLTSPEKAEAFGITTSDLDIIKTVKGLDFPIKAEIQVRTLLQHAWAVFIHKHLYKRKWNLPRAWLRETSRISAMLEDADDSFSRLVEEIDVYKTQYGAYMTPDQMNSEIEMLQLIQRYDPGNESLAREIARIAKESGRWSLVVETLLPFRESADPDSLLDLGNAILHMKDPLQVDEGHRLIERAIELSAKNAPAYITLAQLCRESEQTKRLRYYEMAFQADPNEPMAFCGFLLNKIIAERNRDFLALLRPLIENAVKRCNDRIRAGVDASSSYCHIGILQMALGRMESSASAFAKAATLKPVPRVFYEYRDSVRLLINQVNNQWPELLILDQLFDLFNKAEALQSGSISDISNDLQTTSLIRIPVVIVAGSCNEDSSHLMEAHRKLMTESFQGFQGTIVSGGTRSGVSGLVGDMSLDMGNAVKLGYIPKDIESNQLHPAFLIRRTKGSTFSTLEPIQYWIDLLQSGICPLQVKLIGFGGGVLSAFEYRLALAMGAWVGILPDSRREAARLLDDDDWNGSPNLLRIPLDAGILRSFIHPAPSAAFASDDRERMARGIHGEYRKKHVKRLLQYEPSAVEWEYLRDDLKESNRRQADHYCMTLQSASLNIRKALRRSEIQIIEFTDREIEVMAEREHSRWTVERLMDGWRLGEQNTDRKESPYLVSWMDLSDDIKDYDRNAVKDIPRILEEYGYEVYRETI